MFKNLFRNKSLFTSSSFNFSNIIAPLNFQPPTVYNIKDNPGARIPKTVVGRGPGLGKGKTSGYGHKGMKARNGNPPIQYQGGQTPLTRRLPKHGFRRFKRTDNYSYINLSKILYLIEKERIDPTKEIDLKQLFYSGGITKVKHGVRLLGGLGSRAELLLEKYSPLKIVIASATKDAITKVNKFKGEVICEHKSPLSINYTIKPYKYKKIIQDPIPYHKKVKKLLELEKHGAKLRIRRPLWIDKEYADLTRFYAHLKKKLDSQKNKHLLGEKPHLQYKGQSENRVRIRRKILVKRIVFESKN